MEFLVPHRMQLLEALRTLFPASSRRTLQHWLKGGRFLLDRLPIHKESLWLEKGQLLSSREHFSSKTVGTIKILFSDRSLIAIDKPEGLLSVPLDAPFLQKNALDCVREYYQTDQIFAVHRIDRETSGVLIFARGKESRERLQNLFETHSLRRQYFAIVQGRLKEERGTWESLLLELPSYDVVLTSDPEKGKKAITHFEVFHRSKKYSYLRLQLETGKKHQIRIQCKVAGTPVLGDSRYGATEDPLHRLALHAELIAFAHPFTKKQLLFTSPLPSTFKKLFAGV
jgi:tRNA pseudouridine32 synthase/23S rRNA pseudouridine746 synthase/23S rRNA pseudouridine1911/1915/1917 synthase